MSKLSTSGEEMYKLRRSILFHLNQLFEDGQIDFQLVNNILQYSFIHFAYYDSVTTELITRIIIAFHNKIDGINKKKEETNEQNSLEHKTLDNQLTMTKHQIITTLQITKHYYVKVDSSADIKPKIAALVYERATNTDFKPAIGMYGELLRCFRQIKLGMQLCCTKVDWLQLEEVIKQALLDAFMRLHENGTFMEDAEEILDMVFNSPHYTNADFIRCFKTNQQENVPLLLQYLKEEEKKLLTTLLSDRMKKISVLGSQKPVAKKGDDEEDDPENVSDTEL